MKTPYITLSGLGSTSSAIVGGFFSRLGGVSSGEFSSLNANSASSDSPQNLAANRQIMADTLGFVDAESNIIKIKQIHSNRVITIDKDIRKHTYSSTSTEALECDALITRMKGALLMIKTADCLPLLLHDAKGEVIAAIHAGWRGATSGIIENTLRGMVSLGSSIEDITANIGPCIRKEFYEIGADFMENILTLHPDAERHFSSRDSKIYFDLAGFCTAKLISSGLRHDKIYDCGVDTFSDPLSYFSYRRSFLAAKAASDPNLTAQDNSKSPIEISYGCQFSVIGLKSNS